MFDNVDLTINFAGIRLKNPVLTASGTCGYADELDDFMDINKLGAFITKSITLNPRKGNPTPRIAETNCGMLNAIGLANVGLQEFINQKIPLIEQYKTPFFVNVAGSSIDEYVKVTHTLAGFNAICGFELNISCPNVKQGGISFGTDTALIKDITAQVKLAAANKPVIVKLAPTVTDISKTAEAAIGAGADALSLINTFTAMVIDIHTRKPILANRTGGLSGPAIKPIAVYMVNKVYKEVAKPAGIPVLGLGGITNADDAIEFIIAGASAISIGTASFAQPDCCINIVDGLVQYCKRYGIKKITELIGSVL